MDLLRTITSQMISFSAKKTICMSLNELSRIYNVDYGQYSFAKDDELQVQSKDYPSRVILRQGKKDNIILEFKLEDDSVAISNNKAISAQSEYMLLTNKLRTLISLEKKIDIIDLIEKSKLVNFVDTESLELIKEAIKTSAE